MIIFYCFGENILEKFYVEEKRQFQECYKLNKNSMKFDQSSWVLTSGCRIEKEFILFKGCRTVNSNVSWTENSIELRLARNPTG